MAKAQGTKAPKAPAKPVYTKALLKELDPAALKQLAMSEFGIVPGDDWDDARIMDEILEKVAVQQEREMEAAESGSGERRVRIKIANGEGPDGKGDVFYGHDGRQNLIKRNQEVAIPESHLGTLNNAVITVFDREKDAHGNEQMVARDIPRFNIQVLGYVE